ncbi:MAG: type I phosphomannose isomerase catalytic subunit [Lachnospiraceae bacterium]
MKCLLLAGGRGDRLWPLSRKNYPKQFIQIKNNHSIFQETILRNMAFCDEFIIVANKEYQNIIENQIKIFQGLTYRCVYEEIGRKTTAAILLNIMQFPLSELIFVVASDHLVEGEKYSENVIRAKELAKEGYLVTFGMDIDRPDTRFGYIHHQGEDVLGFTEKPDKEKAKEYVASGEYYINSGMFLFRNGDFLRELKSVSPYASSLYESSFYMRRIEGNTIYYDKEVMEGLPAAPIEKTLFEKTKKGKVVHGGFSWKDIGSLEDLKTVDISCEGNRNVIAKDCEQVEIFNMCSDKVVVANQVKDLVIVNTQDALYVGKNGESDSLKQIIKDNEAQRNFFEKGTVFYRKWGQYELLQTSYEKGYQVRKVTVLPGKTIYLHMHEERTENWCIASGTAKSIVDGNERIISANDMITIPPGVSHQISNIGDKPLIFIETTTGIRPEKEDMIHIQSKDLTEAQLGFAIDPFVRLKPTFKDYLWGGTRLRDEYGKECDYEIIAESWELSAHPAGQSVVASGKYKGLLFGEYLNKIGKENLGWKYKTLKAFPLLIKLIDAKEDLSIQVHPDDDYALEHENEYGKSEMWYMMDCEKDAVIYCGFKRDVTKEEVKEHIERKDLLTLLNCIPVEKGKTYYIPAGTIHAIGKGCVICEIQQNSDTTYRVYDYDRVDQYGNRRKLDVDKALDVMNFKKYEEYCYENEKESEFDKTGDIISRCKYFESIYYNCNERLELTISEESFFAVIIIEGMGTIRYETEELAFKKGDCIFIPKRNARMEFIGKCKFLGTHI